MEDLEKAKAEALESVKKTAEEAAKGETAKAVKGLNDKIAEMEKELKSTTTAEAVEALKAEFEDKLNKLSADVKKQGQIREDAQNEKSFNQYLAEAIKENSDRIQNFKKGSPEVKLSLKAVGDMSIGVNFPGATPFIQDVGAMIYNPYNRVWLADLLPQATSTGNSIIYPKENGGEGAVVHWDGTGEKAQIDYDLSSETAFFKWLAGYVIVEREMLDDIAWLTSYLQQKLLISLKTAENNFVLNGTADTNPVTGLLAAATAYDGTFTKFSEMIIDAAFGQIPSGTNDFFIPSNVVLHPRDTVAVGLNKADGSGEYDLPAGSVNFGAGRLSIAGLDTVSTTSINRNDFVTFDRNAIMFLRRLAPEIRMFEDSELAKVNKVMFRIEERVSMAIFNNLAVVKGTYVAPVIPAG